MILKILLGSYQPVHFLIGLAGNPCLLFQDISLPFLENGLRPWLFEDAVKDTGIGLTLRMHERYDHSYYFISSFMDDHLKWHAERLG